MTDVPVRPTLVDRLAVAVLLVSSVAVVPIFGLMLGSPFLPSQAYMAAAKVFSWSFALLAGVATFHLFSRSAWGEHRRAVAGQPPLARWVKIGTPLMGAMFGSVAVTSAIPMLAAIALGEEVDLQYVVEDPSASSHRGCRHAVELESMPFAFRNVCGVPEELREQLKPGIKIALTGRGTSAGLFYERIKIVPET